MPHKTKDNLAKISLTFKFKYLVTLMNHLFFFFFFFFLNLKHDAFKPDRPIIEQDEVLINQNESEKNESRTVDNSNTTILFIGADFPFSKSEIHTENYLRKNQLLILKKK